MSEGTDRKGVQDHQDHAERRKEERYEVPEVYRRYVRMLVQSGVSAEPATLCNFSRHGILFEGPGPIAEGTSVLCSLSIENLLSKNIQFSILVRFCRQQGGVFIIGGSIDEVEDEMWFNVFAEVHDFIVLRQGSVY